ncbi:MAG: hypothetical protein H0Z19_09045 [Archaeoglobus sp.]|uniref:hypothetical protein n=1 Tax=Archaeoglobus sp. TaxID=1872626 RepID=UPI001D43E5D3|nr:hypothetical protein [Archaeoglobus sp.]MBO8180602.1 hypothetical protein [Archaeoglobus sp.]
MARKEPCPNCGEMAEIVSEGDREILRCAKCGTERVIVGKEEILPIEKKLVAGSIILAIILLAILYYVSYQMIAHIYT